MKTIRLVIGALVLLGLGACQRIVVHEHRAGLQYYNHHWRNPDGGRSAVLLEPSSH